MRRRVSPSRTLAVTGGSAALVLAVLSTPATMAADKDPAGPSTQLERAAAGVTRGPAWTASMRTRNFAVVGHSDVGGRGLNADVWEHAGFAYVGVWSGPCPATGVKVVDVRNPHHPTRVSRLQNPAGTSAEDVVVRHVETDSFSGDLAVVGIQTCDDPAETVFRGLQFFDVTDPSRPRQLGRYRVRDGTVGCHEVDLAVRPDGGVVAGCANVFAEQIRGSDEVIVVDASDPSAPSKAGGFRLGDIGVDPASTPQNVGCFAASFAHSVRFSHQARTLFASYWDYGTLRFDVRPSLGLDGPVGRTDIAPPDEDGDNHSMTLARSGGTMVVNPEDFSPVECGQPFQGWGEAHVYTNERSGRNELLSIFSTPNSRSMRTDGFYSIHNTEAAGTQSDQMMSSWYSDGVVWWSLAERRDPVMRGQFVPPPTEDPTGTFPPVPLIWGVYPDPNSDLVFASDINSGLWILRPTGLGDF